MIPIFRMAGGKQLISPTIVSFFPELKQKRYIEPFVGAGSVFCQVLKKEEIPDSFLINDINTNIINLYNVIKTEDLYEKITTLLTDFLNKDLESRKIIYYEIRKEFNFFKLKHNLTKSEEIDQAIRFLFLMKTNFNGMYRENSKGEYNIGFGNFGSKGNYGHYDLQNFKNWQKTFNMLNICITNTDYKNIDYSQPNSFYYLDPPYYPISKTSNFTKYHKLNFDEQEQINLKNYCKKINDSANMFALSNSNCEFIRTLYKDFNIREIIVRRSVSGDPSARIKIKELVITNY